jgi:hypothetical protein
MMREMNRGGAGEQARVRGEPPRDGTDGPGRSRMVGEPDHHAHSYRTLAFQEIGRLFQEMERLGTPQIEQMKLYSI